MRRAVVVAGAMVVLLGSVAGVGSAGAVATTRLAAGPDGSGGSWGTAIEVPGTAALNTGGYAAIGSVSCASAGNCSAGGDYKGRGGHYQAFVVSQADGTWDKAIEVPGIAALGTGGGAEIVSVSCGAAGNCSAGGGYPVSPGHYQVFVVSQAHGIWGTAIEVPGIAALNTGGNAAIGAAGRGREVRHDAAHRRRQPPVHR